MSEQELPGIPAAVQVIDAAEGTPMTLDEHIQACLEFKAAHPGSGSWLVQKYLAGARYHAGRVELAHPKVSLIKSQGRAIAVPQFWQAKYDDESLRGAPVVRLL